MDSNQKDPVEPEEEDEVPNQCNICFQVPENFITLKCLHDICIECTASNLKQNQNEEGTLDEF